MGSDSAPKSQPDQAPEKAAANRGKRRSRLRRRIVAALLLAFIVAAALPRLASTTFGRDFLVSLVNERTATTLRVEAVSLSWFGPCAARNVRLDDVPGGHVVQIEKIETAQGLLKTLIRRGDIDDLSLRSVRARVQVGSDQMSSRSKSAPPSAEDTNTLLIQAAEAHAAYTDGRLRLNASNLADVIREAQADHDRPKQALLEITELDATQSENGFDFTVRAHGLIAPVVELLTGQAGAKGTVQLSASGSIARRDIQVTGTAELLEAQFGSPEHTPSGTLDAQMTIQYASTPASIEAEIELRGEAGDARVALHYTRADEAIRFSANDLLNAALAGSALPLSDFQIEAQSDINLSVVGRAAPALLHVRHDTTLTGGRMRLEGVTLQGGAWPSFKGRIQLADLAGESAGRRIEIAPASLNIDVAIESGKGFVVRQAELRSNFVQITARGGSEYLQAEFQADLAAARRQLEQIFDFGALTVSGSLAGTLEAKRPDADHVDITVDVSADRLHVGSVLAGLNWKRARIKSSGQLSLADGRVQRISANSLEVTLDNKLSGQVAGWYEPASGAMRIDIDLDRIEVAEAARYGSLARWNELSPYGGWAEVQTRVERSGHDKLLALSGRMLVHDAARDGQPLCDGDLELTWDAARLDIGVRRLRSITVQRVGVAVGNRFQAELTGWCDPLLGTFETEVEVMQAEMPLLAKPWRLTVLDGFGGSIRLHADLKRTQVRGEITFNGEATINDLAILRDDVYFRRKQVELTYQGVLTPAQNKVTFQHLKATTAGLTAEASGQLADYRDRCALSLRGQYRAEWAGIREMFHELLPAAADSIVLSGPSAGEFTLSGPLCEQGAQPLAQQLQGRLGLSWDSANLFGLPLEGGAVSPALREGLLRLPRTRVPALGGFATLTGLIDLSTEEAILRIPGTVQLLDKLQINAELAESLLSRINPIFVGLARAEGLVSLRTQDLALPLGSTMHSGGSGRGHLDLTKMRVQPSGLLAELLHLGGIDHRSLHAAEISSVDFEIRDGRIHYKNFEMKFGDTLEMRFYGSVGFDDTLDLVVSLPVRSALLDQLRMDGTIMDVLGVLGNTRIDIPIVGTRLKPRLDLSAIDLTKMLLPDGGLLPNLRDLLGGEKKEKKKKKRRGAKRRPRSSSGNR